MYSKSSGFVEVQRFPKLLILIITIISGSILLFGIFRTDRPLILLGLILVSIAILFLIIRLEFRVNATFIQYEFFPFVKKDFLWQEIDTAEVIDYGFVGGWGIRLWTKYGTVYNVKGSKGLYVKLKNGKSFVVGTQKSDELKTYLNNLR